ENLAAVQFNHRLLATVTATFALATVALMWRRSAGVGRLALGAIGALVCTQYILGVATLLTMVPVGLGTLHQGVAILLLSSALVTLYLHGGAGSGDRRQPSL
ncbi:MAG: heme A synthase, partial [Alphaproteobacteria bacterium]